MNCMPHARSPPLFALSNGRWRIYDDIDDVHVQVYIKQMAIQEASLHMHVHEGIGRKTYVHTLLISYYCKGEYVE